MEGSGIYQAERSCAFHYRSGPRKKDANLPNRQKLVLYNHRPRDFPPGKLDLRYELKLSSIEILDFKKVTYRVDLGYYCASVRERLQTIAFIVL